jgi:hypothetical protein
MMTFGPLIKSNDTTTQKGARHMKQTISFTLATVLALATASNLRSRSASAPPRQSYDVAAYIWPSYYPDDRAKIFWPEGIGEWQTVMNNQPKFDGQDQPRIPLWGYVNESDPSSWRWKSPLPPTTG